ncbi:3'-5' exoribonuclease [Stenotrophomonas phage BUCT555]|nr:3'-5' exoribonuclease [Stenotrophomonas phage BUCT555]
MSQQAKTEVHIVPDIETFGLATTSVVGSIGLVAFTVQGGEVGSLFILPDMGEQQEFGRTKDRATCEWWNHPDRAEARTQFDGEALSVTLSCNLIRTFVQRFETKSTTVAGIWGFGADFDNAVLQDLCRMHPGMAAPWNYKLNRCGRTLAALYPDVPKPPNKGIHHHALDDARWEAQWFRSIMMYRNGANNTLKEVLGSLT